MATREVVGTSIESEARTPWGVHCVETFDVGKEPCNAGKIIYLTRDEYEQQMNRPDARWRCPRCLGEAYWDDDNYEELEELDQ